MVLLFVSVEYCYGVVCPLLKICVVDTENQTSCTCDYKCDDYYNPVCGSNNKTYDSPCHLNEHNCRTNSSVTFSYVGVCSEGQTPTEFV